MRFTIAHRAEVEVGADGHASTPPSGAAAAAPPAASKARNYYLHEENTTVVASQIRHSSLSKIMMRELRSL
jgi:hypothetical protein